MPTKSQYKEVKAMNDDTQDAQDDADEQTAESIIEGTPDPNDNSASYGDYE